MFTRTPVRVRVRVEPYLCEIGVRPSVTATSTGRHSSAARQRSPALHIAQRQKAHAVQLVPNRSDN